MKLTLGAALAFAVLSTACAATPFAAFAADGYPNKPVTMVVPFAAGGATDVIARIIGEKMGDRLGQRIVIENVGGAGGTIGSRRVRDAAPDGYTILTGHMGTHASSYSLYKKPPYDPRTDFEPIGLAASAPIVVFVGAKYPSSTLAEFRKAAGTAGAKLTLAHSGVGSNAHLTCALFNSLIGANPTDVPYRGNGPLMTDLVGGQVDYSCDQIITIASHVKGGTAKALGITGAARSKLLPDVPTFAEAGLPAYDPDAWTAFFAPKGTPEGILARLNQAYSESLDDPSVRDRLEGLGAVVPAKGQRTRAHLSALVKSDIDRWAKVIKAANIPQQE